MKTTFRSVLILSSVLALPVQADTLLGLYVGAQGWDMDTQGGFANDASLTEFDFEKETKASFYAALEHPIPLLPNLKARRTNFDSGGDIVLTSNFTFNGEIFSATTPLTTQVEMTQTDFVLYYELFDNDLLSFDFGVNGKYVDGEIFVQDAADVTNSAREEFSGVVPMVYSRLQIGLPLSGFGAYAEGSYLSIDDHSLSDYEVALTYAFIENLAVDMTLQLGYRASKLELDDLDNIYSDLEFKGVFAGLEVHF